METREGMPLLEYGQGRDLYSIEHLLPNGEALTDGWRSDLVDWNDPQPDLTWRDHRHTLGNLTLTIHNAAVSNGRWGAKRTYYTTNAGLEMTRRAIVPEEWTRREIELRTSDLVDLAISVWPPPPSS